ncbi:hypothetical protein [Streptomyces sp. SID3343]|uniref:hypothetical protein n=1 Tax=Streptomyces sp. SID3343 TaxID=2690260 RepID=UPI001368C1DB|nr:hypothetical protein [Streptomyces sp. SID3343]
MLPRSPTESQSGHRRGQDPATEVSVEPGGVGAGGGGTVARDAQEAELFSTTAANHASRSVARALGLAPPGWIWTAR